MAAASMLRSARSADSVSCADRSSWNRSGETLFSPMVSACTDRLRTISPRNVTQWYATKPLPARRSAVVLARTLIQISFCRMVALRH